ncbi:MAG: hypothetical protein Phog2KO_26550 [Phototrophicaceae bacterium]
MDLGLLVTISCVMTTISMILLIGVILFFARFGGQGVKMLIDRVMGGGDDKQNEQSPVRERQAQTAVASSSSLRQRAQQLDFPAPAGGTAQFGAQSAGSSLGQNSYPDFPPPQNQNFGQQQATLRPRGQYPEFNPQSQAINSAQNFQVNTPSLSPSRPFQAGSSLTPRPQQNNQVGQQQVPQQGNNFNQPNQFGQQNLSQQGGLPPLGNSQQGFNAQGLSPQQGQVPQQQNLPPLGNNQQGQVPPQVPNQQFGGLGGTRPPLRSVPRPSANDYDRPIGGRDSRKGDDRDYIYDDRRSGGNFIDDVGDFLDNV